VPKTRRPSGVNVQLIHARPNASVGPKSTCKLTDVFAVESEIAKAIRRKAAGQVTGRRKCADIAADGKPRSTPALLEGAYFWK